MEPTAPTSADLTSPPREACIRCGRPGEERAMPPDWKDGAYCDACSTQAWNEWERW